MDFQVWWKNDYRKKVKQLAECIGSTTHEIDFFVTKIYVVEHSSNQVIDSDDEVILERICEKYKEKKDQRKKELEKKILHWYSANEKLIEDDFLIGDSREAKIFKDYFFFYCLKVMTYLQKGKETNWDEDTNKAILNTINKKIKNYFGLPKTWNRWKWANEILDNLKNKKNKAWINDNKDFIKELSEFWEEVNGKDNISMNNFKHNAIEAMERYVDIIRTRGRERLLIFYEYLMAFCLEKQFFVTLDIFSSEKENISKMLEENFKNHYWPLKMGIKTYKALQGAIRKQKNKRFLNKYQLIYEPKKNTDAKSVTRYWFKDENSSSVAIIQHVNLDVIRNIMITSHDVQQFSKKLNTKSKYLIYSFLFWKEITEYYNQNLKINLYDLMVSYKINIHKDSSYDKHIPIDEVKNIKDENKSNRIHYDELSSKIILEIKAEIDNLIVSLQRYIYFKEPKIVFLYIYLFYSSVEKGKKLKPAKLHEVLNIRNSYRAKEIFRNEAQKFLNKFSELYWAQAVNILKDEVEKKCIKYYGKEELESLKAKCFSKDN